MRKTISGAGKITDFQRKVYDAVSLVPFGYVTTYRMLAGYIGCRSNRAVGQALKRNPFAPSVPCHRVISSDLSPGGFQGRMRGAAIGKKIALLAKEGVRFRRNRLADGSKMFRFDS